MPDRSTAVDPVEAFALLGEEIRLDALRAVFEAPGEAVPFSEIRDRVAVRDPGHVNYHLGELTPHFLERTPEGYTLQRPGYAALRVLHEGKVTDGGTLERHDLGACVRCAGDLVLDYGEGQFATVACRDCGRWFVRYVFPPGALDGRDPDAVAAVLDQRCRSARRLGNAGVCPMCSGRMTAALDADDQFDLAAKVTYRCDRCGCVLDSTPGAAVVSHPAVVAFLQEEGIDPRERPLWQFPFAYSPDHLRVLERGPRRVAVTVPAGDVELACVLDCNATVVETDRDPDG